MSHPPITPEMFPDGIICGCPCGCSRPLTNGNAMLAQQVDPDRKPWESDDELPVFVSVCADCYVGTHAARSSETGE